MAKIAFLPKEQRFFDLFEASSKNIIKAARVLKEMVDTWQSANSSVSEITEMEHEGDSITHQIISLLHRTFVTPFDREDIALLAHILDDIIDFIHAAADAMFIYKVSAPTQRAKELADIILQSTIAVGKAVKGLHAKSEFKNILEECVEMNWLENAADRVYRAAIGELFEEKDMAKIIKWREIYEHMESTTDKCEDVANVLEGVALKNA